MADPSGGALVNGKAGEEREAKNNHGVCRVVQAAAFARLTRKRLPAGPAAEEVVRHFFIRQPVLWA